jgi:hypothetical protein
MLNQIIAIVVVLAAAMASNVAAFTASRVYPPSTISPPSSTAIHAAAASSRRDLFSRTGSVISTALVTAAAAFSSSAVDPALAADGAPPTPAEIERIRTGYENIQYLLANWEKETTVCRANGGQCERNADACRKYMGLRSTTDPLFQIEKVFAKVKYMDDIDPDKLDSFFEATEDW